MLTGGPAQPEADRTGKGEHGCADGDRGRGALRRRGRPRLSGSCGRASWSWRPCSRSAPASSTCWSRRATWTGERADAEAGSGGRGAGAGGRSEGAGLAGRAPAGGPAPAGERPGAPRPRRLPRPGRRGRARDRRRPGRPPVLGRARAQVGAGPGPRVRAAGAGGDLHLRQQVRLLLHPPAAEGPAEEPLRQGRRLPALVPPRQLHHADRSAGERDPADRRPSPVAALHLRPRHGPGAAALPAREPQDDPGGPHGAAPAPGRRRDPPAHADRAVPRPQRRPASRAHGARAGRASPGRGDRGRRARRPHAAPRRAVPAPVDHARRGGRDPGRDPRVAGGLPGPARDAARLRRGRAVPPGGPADSVRRGVRELLRGRGRDRSRAAVRGRSPASRRPARAPSLARGARGDGGHRRAVRTDPRPAAGDGSAYRVSGPRSFPCRTSSSGAPSPWPGS